MRGRARAYCAAMAFTADRPALQLAFSFVTLCDDSDGPMAVLDLTSCTLSADSESYPLGRIPIAILMIRLTPD